MASPGAFIRFFPAGIRKRSHLQIIALLPGKKSYFQYEKILSLRNPKRLGPSMGAKSERRLAIVAIGIYFADFFFEAGTVYKNPLHRRTDKINVSHPILER
jgi:hypothetical protein